jgi:hypothetical protein
MLGCEVISRFDPPGLAFLRLGDVRLLLDGTEGNLIGPASRHAPD